MCTLYRLICIFLLAGSQLIALTACANDDVVFVPPAERPVNNSERDWPLNHVLALAYHDVEDSDPDQTFVSVNGLELRRVGKRYRRKC